MTALRTGVCLVVAFAVLAHGAVEPWSESLLALLAVALFLVWALVSMLGGRADIEWNPLLLPLCGLMLVALVQWGLGLSAYAYLSRIEWMKLSAYLLLAFVATQAFRHTEGYRPFVWFLLFFGFAVALFGILQYFTWNGKLYWVRELRESTYSFGPYVNRNHFAGLMELVIPFGLAVFLFPGGRRGPLPLAGLFTGVAIGALLLCASRGGAVSFAFQLVLLVALVWLRRAGRAAIALAAVVLVLAGVFAGWLGVAETFTRFRGDWSDEVTSSRRLVILRDSWNLFRERPMLGTGAGTFSTVYPRVESFHDGKIVNHAHNDYAEVLVETGSMGGILGVIFLWLLFRRTLGREGALESPAADIRVGALVACCGLLVHGLVDFNLRIPSNALLFLLCAGIAVSSEREGAVVPLRPPNHLP